MTTAEGSAAAAAEAGVPPEEDYVVREIDVYMTNKLSNLLCMLQYPTRPAWRPLDTSLLNEVRLKPNLQKLEVEYAIKPGPTLNEEGELQVNKFTMTSSSVPCLTNYAVGILRENKGWPSAEQQNDQLHLTPLHTILQMRPSLAYLDEADTARRKEMKEQDATEEGAEVEMHDEQPQALQVTFKKKETQKALQARKQSAAYLMKLEEEESWVKLKLFDNTAPENMAVFDKLVCTNDAAIRWNVSRRQYLDVLAPLPPLDDYLKKQRETLAKQMLSKDELSRLPPGPQVLAILKTGGVVHFSKVRALATNAKTDTLVLKLLQDCAVLIRGCWIVKRCG
eukprot:TRINITY_DN3966_c0_g3_i1.p1 TRINITY_DN3966_c0_g3~~TRINITY_DN3966_c0_g3_i1.p1  ORF type:complete len:337 (-),score=126.24 TRINITY_DN3966_c0_g3_i1:182-1192(-)